jgi:hypothetical protein
MPARPRTALKAASETTVSFPTWDELVAEATVDLEPYQIPFADGSVIEVPCPTGDMYLDLVAAQKRGDAAGILEALFPDNVERIKIRKHMRGTKEHPVHFPIVDVLAGKILRYYYGLSIESQETSGN